MERNALEIAFKNEKGKTIAAVNGRLDAMSAPEFEKSVLEQVESGTDNLIVDLSQVDYISSAGLRSILVIAKKLRSKAGELAVAGLKDTVKEVFEISGFNTILPLFDTVSQALEKV